MVIVELRGGHLGAVGRAAALALARVLAFATVVAALTPTIALAGVLCHVTSSLQYDFYLTTYSGQNTAPKT